MTHAIQIVFLVAVPIAFVAFLLSFLLPEVELRKTVQTVDVGEVNGSPDPRSSLQEIELALDAAVGPGEPGRALPDAGPAGGHRPAAPCVLAAVPAGRSARPAR